MATSRPIRPASWKGVKSPLKGSSHAGSFLRQHVPSGRALRLHRSSPARDCPASPEQQRPTAGKGLQIDVGSNLLGPGMFQERHRAQSAHLLAAVEIHDDGPTERASRANTRNNSRCRRRRRHRRLRRPNRPGCRSARRAGRRHGSCPQTPEHVRRLIHERVRRNILCVCCPRSAGVSTSRPGILRSSAARKSPALRIPWRAVHAPANPSLSWRTIRAPLPQRSDRQSRLHPALPAAQVHAPTGSSTRLRSQPRGARTAERRRLAYDRDVTHP